MVFGYAVGLDMTRRDLQDQAKELAPSLGSEQGLRGLGALFARSCRRAPSAIPRPGAIRLDVNGERRQTGDLAEMIWKVPEIIAHLSRLFTLAPGDLIFTGTPCRRRAGQARRHA